jgi:hypothetical protein
MSETWNSTGPVECGNRVTGGLDPGWGSPFGDRRRSEADAGVPPPLALQPVAPPVLKAEQPAAPETNEPGKPPPVSTGDFSNVPHGYAADWNTIRFSNTTQEPVTVVVTVAAGQALPQGMDANGQVTIQPGQSVDLTFAPGSSANFRSTKGDGSVWNQGEVFFDEANKIVWGNMSYIYGANSNMRMFSQDGQHAGYLGDLVDKAPPAARVGEWGIVAPYDRFNHSDDPNNPGSATGGPLGAKNAGSTYLYSVLDKGEGYVGRGRPAEVTDYDDASSLRFAGNLAVVF